MGRYHLARVGAWAEVGRFQAVDAVCYPRGARVVLRTIRGLETGEILAPPGEDDDDFGRGDGSILRGLTVGDDLLLARLERNREAAIAACERAISERGLDVTLVDAEPLFDGQTLVFYFLGPQSAELEELTAELAEVYEGQVQFRRFAAAVEAGCGPGCGTSETGACGTAAGGCGSCSTQGCGVASRRPKRNE